MLSATTLLVLITKDKNLWVEETVKRRGAEANSENVNVSPFFRRWRFPSFQEIFVTVFYSDIFLFSPVLPEAKGDRFSEILKM